MEFWSCDIGSAYLESYTKFKVYIIAGSESGDREGHALVTSKALYGLKSSGLRCHERLADVLRDMGFFPSHTESDIWMRDMGEHYE
jgi:Reverse transcriptase (RNA-dependent DNA polymerase)